VLKTLYILQKCFELVYNILTQDSYYGRIVVELDVVDSNIAKKIKINHRDYIIE
jgi:hypothetical protein